MNSSLWRKSAQACATPSWMDRASLEPSNWSSTASVANSSKRPGTVCPADAEFRCCRFCWSAARTPSIQVRDIWSNSVSASRAACMSRTARALSSWLFRWSRTSWQTLGSSNPTCEQKRWRVAWAKAVRAGEVATNKTGSETPHNAQRRESEWHQADAPWFGSSGLPSRLSGLIRSSRLMPSHMATAAATKMDE